MKKRRPYLRLILSLLFTLFLIATGIIGSFLAFNEGYSYTLNILEESSARQQNPNIKQLTLTLTSNFTLDDLTDVLYKNNFIANKTFFRLQGKLGGYEDAFISGNYALSSNMSNTDILELITTLPKEENTIKFTIPEGFTIIQIANRLDDLGIVSKDEFLKAVNEREYDYSFLEDVPSSSKYKLEGYLFPDTYIVNKDVTPEEIILKMLNRFEQVIDQYSQYLHNNSYTLHELVTIASIIEHEAKLSEERPIISGVIYNRLKADMMLQMCSTVQYDLEKRKANLSFEDLEIDSPYNTYKYKGLPLGPICMPGENALKAALLPETNNYYYFVLTDIKSGKHVFSRTAQEHEQNKFKYSSTIDKNFYE